MKEVIEGYPVASCEDWWIAKNPNCVNVDVETLDYVLGDMGALAYYPDEKPKTKVRITIEVIDE